MTNADIEGAYSSGNESIILMLNALKSISSGLL